MRRRDGGGECGLEWRFGVLGGVYGGLWQLDFWRGVFLVCFPRVESNGRGYETGEYWCNTIFWWERAISDTRPCKGGTNFDVSAETMDITNTTIYRNNIPLRRVLGLQMA